MPPQHKVPANNEKAINISSSLSMNILFNLRYFCNPIEAIRASFGFTPSESLSGIISNAKYTQQYHHNADVTIPLKVSHLKVSVTPKASDGLKAQPNVECAKFVFLHFVPIIRLPLNLE
jgi:hypothetical protein